MIDKNDFENLIERAKSALGNNDEGVHSYSLLEVYIREAENVLLDIEGPLNATQQEIYDRLEVAVSL